MIPMSLELMVSISIAIFVAFGAVIYHALKNLNQLERKARAQTQEEEWQEPVFAGLSQSEFKLWRAVVAETLGLLPAYRIQNETREALGEIEAHTRHVVFGTRDLEAFVQEPGGNYIGEVGGRFSDSVVFKKSGQVYAEAVPSARTENQGFEIFLPGKRLSLEYLDNRLGGLRQKRGASGRVFCGEREVARYTYSEYDPRSGKILFAFHDSLSPDEKLILIAVVRSWYSATPRKGDPERWDADPSPRFSQRWGLGMIFAFPLLVPMALLMADMLFVSRKEYLDYFTSVWRIWLAAIVVGTAIAIMLRYSVRGATKPARDVTLMLGLLVGIFASAVGFHIVNLKWDPASMETRAIVRYEFLPQQGKRHYFRIDVDEPNFYGKHLTSHFGMDLATERASRVIASQTTVRCRVHRGFMGLNWVSQKELEL